MTYAVYNQDTGDILRLDTSETAPEGETFIEVPPGTPWPEVPRGARWRVVGGTPVMVELRTLAQAKADAWVAIKAQRDARMQGTFTHAGSTYDIDPVNLSGASIDAREALIAGEAFSQMWVLADDTVTTLTATEMIAVGRACKAVVSSLWAISQYLRGLVDASTTITEIEAITWP